MNGFGRQSIQAACTEYGQARDHGEQSAALWSPRSSDAKSCKMRREAAAVIWLDASERRVALFTGVGLLWRWLLLGRPPEKHHSSERKAGRMLVSFQVS